MKNQYFGDNRDLFKYDLILRVIKETNSIDHFTFIPMLTEDDDTKEGEKRNPNKVRAGRKNDDLVDFLDKFKDKNRRDIEHIKSFFEKQGIGTTIYYYGKNKYFSHLQRDEYFKQIDNKLLSKSLVFVDPDKGLEIDRPRKEHILYSEVKSLYERMDKNSILMIFQCYPRIRTENNIQKYFCERSEKLKNIAGVLSIYMDDNEVRFFFLTKDKSLRKSLTKTVSGYKMDYPELRVGNT